jgi:hypothetical protein
VLYTWGTLRGQFRIRALCTQPNCSYGTLADSRSLVLQQEEGRAASWRVHRDVYRNTFHNTWSETHRFLGYALRALRETLACQTHELLRPTLQLFPPIIRISHYRQQHLAFACLILGSDPFFATPAQRAVALTVGGIRTLRASYLPSNSNHPPVLKHPRHNTERPCDTVRIDRYGAGDPLVVLYG